MPGYSFRTSMTLDNPKASEVVVTIPRGTIIEPESTHLSFQSAIVSKDYVFRLNPREKRSVILDCDCWNQHLSPPRGIAGNPTSLKGKIETTTRVWNVSSKPKASTVLVSPSQDGHVVSALANASRQIAISFVERALDRASKESDVTEQRAVLAGIVGAHGGSFRKNLREFAEDRIVRPFLGARALRAFLISEGGAREASNVEAVIRLCTDLYITKPHKLTTNLYTLANDLEHLREREKYTIDEEDKGELEKVIRQKFLDLVDALPLLDEIEAKTEA